MKRPAPLACVQLPALTLQIAHQRGELTSDVPGVVCNGVFVAWPNRMAKRGGVRCGMRVSQARTLMPMLQTATVSDQDQQQAMQQVWQYLLNFSPDIEIDAQHSGLLWLDPNGLQHLFGSHAQWGEAVHRHLLEHRYHADVVVGFNRYLARALAQKHHICFVCEDPDAEKAAADILPLSYAPLPAEVREALLLLGVATLGDFLRMPVNEVRQALGDEAEHIHRLAHDQVYKPLVPQRFIAPHEVQHVLDTPDHDAHRLLFLIKSMLQPLLDELQKTCQACVAVHLQLQLHTKKSRCERVAPAQPTLDARRLIELIRLRLLATVLSAPVECITLRIEGQVVRAEQLLMLQQKPKRDLQAARNALAKIRALMGEAAVTRAQLCDSWLPESSFRWEALSEVVLPCVNAPTAAPFPMVRSLSGRDIKQWLRRDGRLKKMHGPYRLYGKWWQQVADRDYYYIQTESRNILWVYHSRPQNRWFHQGYVS